VAWKYDGLGKWIYQEALGGPD